MQGTVDSTANAPDTAYHKYGVLWMPAAQNAGSGYWKFYYDDTLYMTLSYSAGGAPSLTTTAATSVCYYSTSFANEAWPGTHCTASGMFSDADGDTEIALLGKGYVGFSNTYQYFHLWKAP